MFIQAYYRRIRDFFLSHANASRPFPFPDHPVIRPENEGAVSVVRFESNMARTNPASQPQSLNQGNDFFVRSLYASRADGTNKEKKARQSLVRFAVSGMMMFFALAPVAEACSVPVFRWALERWQADRYELMVFRNSPLSEADLARFRALDQRAMEANRPANLLVRDMDMTLSTDDPYAVVWEKAQDRPLPVCYLMYPRGTHVSTPAWSGTLSELSPDALFDSPVRRELSRRLLAGHSGVWLLLGCGDRAKNEVAGRVLVEGIDHANKTLRLPDMTGDETLAGPNPPDLSNLRIEFSRIIVDRDDPAEAMLVRMLLGSEPDLASLDEPMAFPVYGRGRVLYALAGRGINAETVAKAHAFLAGPCACEIKAENPGTDLLMAVDWEKGIGDNTAIGAVEWPPLPGIATADTGFREKMPGPRPTAYGFVRNAIAAVAAAAVLLMAATFVLLVRRRGR